jgi:formylglycine-generating enzyme required for sulfatase activity
MPASAPTLLFVRRQRLGTEAFRVRLAPDRDPELAITMVKIPEGSFEMGSTPEEVDRYPNEGPRHKVTLQKFWMSRTPITQAQWGEVAGWEPGRAEEAGLQLNPDPSRFKRDDRPVERVNWFEAMEFCRRLSVRTGRTYTLPSEAQWEYACRAGTSTPFHFGATITPELVNYNGNVTYTHGPKGQFRQQTTPVASFPANAWGLHDMHGNVLEWCLDHWHESYKLKHLAGGFTEAPSDGSAWLDVVELNERKDNKNRLLRGGSWSYGPGDCRSACRDHFLPFDASSSVGFRVVCLPQDPSLNS